MRPPPRSTLFPYTTLFRSAADRLGDQPLQFLAGEQIVFVLVAVERDAALLVDRPGVVLGRLKQLSRNVHARHQMLPSGLDDEIGDDADRRVLVELDAHVIAPDRIDNPVKGAYLGAVLATAANAVGTGFGELRVTGIVEAARDEPMVRHAARQ